MAHDTVDRASGKQSGFLADIVAPNRTNEPRRKMWSKQEDEVLMAETTTRFAEGGFRDWKAIADRLPGRTNKDCRKRWIKVRVEVNKGAWSASEDELLEAAVGEFGPKWTLVANRVATRHAEQCAKRWHHFLDPSLDRSSWTEEEDIRLLWAIVKHGNSWRQIVNEGFPGRSTTNVKNRYAVLAARRPDPSEFGTDAAFPSAPSPEGSCYAESSSSVGSSTGSLAHDHRLDVRYNNLGEGSTSANHW